MDDFWRIGMTNAQKSKVFDESLKSNDIRSPVMSFFNMVKDEKWEKKGHL
jgi:hypothetical protein